MFRVRLQQSKGHQNNKTVKTQSEQIFGVSIAYVGNNFLMFQLTNEKFLKFSR